MTPADLIAFEREVADRFERGEIRGPIHLSGGNEEQLIDIFKNVPKHAWVFSTWRSHYHALLHGVPPDKVMAQIMAGRSMNLAFPEHQFFTSAIVGGILPIACGVAASGANVYAFIGDMAASIGAFKEASKYASRQNLPLTIVVEDNGLSTNTPTIHAWGRKRERTAYRYREYAYERRWPHTGSGVYVAF